MPNFEFDSDRRNRLGHENASTDHGIVTFGLTAHLVPTRQRRGIIGAVCSRLRGRGFGFGFGFGYMHLHSHASHPQR
jgi:hypothetical protein